MLSYAHRPQRKDNPHTDRHTRRHADRDENITSHRHTRTHTPQRKRNLTDRRTCMHRPERKHNLTQTDADARAQTTTKTLHRDRHACTRTDDN